MVITDADLVDFNNLTQTFAQVIKLMQAELDVSVYTGTRTVEIRFGDALAGATGLETTYSSLDPLPLGPLRELINDLHLSTLEPAWSSAHGGALRLRAVFEEEGTEIRGTLDFDLKHMALDLFFVPGLDRIGQLTWAIETGVVIDGPALLDAQKRQIESALVESELTLALTEALAPVTRSLGLYLGLDRSPLSRGRFESVQITDGRADFREAPEGGRRLDVIFDAVSVFDDSDWPGQGELSFMPTVQGISQPFSEEYSAASGTRVALQGAHWRVPIVLAEGADLSIALTMRDRETIGKDETRGTAHARFTASELGELGQPRRFDVRSDAGDFEVHGRIEDPIAEPDLTGTREVRVVLEQVQQLRDRDSFGKGEVAFQLIVNGFPSSVSVAHKAAGRDDASFDPRDAAGRLLAVTVHPRLDEVLTVVVLGWDIDPSQRDAMGSVVAVYAAERAFDGSEEVLRSGNGDFITTLTITEVTDDGSDGDGDGDGATRPDDPTGEPPTPPVARLVIFDALTLTGDGDTFGPGEIVVEGRVQDRADAAMDQGKDWPIGGGEPLKTGHGATLPLVGEIFRRQVALPPSHVLHVSAKVIDVDGDRDLDASGNDDTLTTLSANFGPDQAHGLGVRHLRNADGDIDLTVRIVDPANTGEVTAIVRFERYVILRDHTALAPGKFWCRAFVNGFPLDDGEKINTEGGDDDTSDHAGRGDTVNLDIATWQRTVHFAPGGEIQVEFEVFEARDNDHKSLGRVRADFREPLTESLKTLTPPSGDYTVELRVMPPIEDKANQFVVRFLEVQVLDDGDITSEGELVFIGSANLARTPQSTVMSARKGETLRLVGEAWTLSTGVDVGDRLDVSFTMFDEDRHTLQSLGVALAQFNHMGRWGLGEHLVTAAGNAFRVRFVVEPAGPRSMPDLPGLVQRRVVFRSATVTDDGDWADNGEITFDCDIGSTAVLATPQYKVSSGDTVFFGSTDRGQSVWLAPDDELRLTVRATEHDNSRTEVLGTATAVLAGPDWGGANPQRMPASSGAFSVEFQILDDSKPAHRVRFQRLQIDRDHEAFGRGEIVCEAVVNGIATGRSERMKAGSDADTDRDDLKSAIFLGGPRWARQTWLRDEQAHVLPLRFTAWEHDVTGDRLIGTVDTEIELDGEGWYGAFFRREDPDAQPATDPDVRSIQFAGPYARHFSLAADTGAFTVTLLVVKPLPNLDLGG